MPVGFYRQYLRFGVRSETPPPKHVYEFASKTAAAAPVPSHSRKPRAKGQGSASPTNATPTGEKQRGQAKISDFLDFGWHPLIQRGRKSTKSGGKIITRNHTKTCI